MGVEASDTRKHHTHRPPRRLGPQTWQVGGAWLLAGNPQIKSAPTGSPAGSLALDHTCVWSYFHARVAACAEVAVSVVVERGGAGADVAFIARNILDAYITIRGYSDSSEPEMALLK